MNVIYIIMYFIFSVSGSTLIKYGGMENIKSILYIPYVNINISLYTILGFLLYSISFILYIILLNKFQLSFISPVTVAGVYILLMITAFIIFKEPITTNKIIGSTLILFGILFMVKS